MLAYSSKYQRQSQKRCILPSFKNDFLTYTFIGFLGTVTDLSNLIEGVISGLLMITAI